MKMSPHEIEFFQVCYRDVLKELVRSHGMEGLMQAPRVSTLAKSYGIEAVKAMRSALVPPCAVCEGKGQVLLFGSHESTPCPICHGTGEQVEREDASALRVIPATTSESGS
jgi:DnaJ-class molecular chaperone